MTPNLKQFLNAAIQQEVILISYEVESKIGKVRKVV